MVWWHHRSLSAGQIKHKGSWFFIIIIIISGDEPVSVYPVRLSDTSSFTAEQRVETDKQIRAARTSSITVMSSPLLINISESERHCRWKQTDCNFTPLTSDTRLIFICMKRKNLQVTFQSVLMFSLLVIWSEVSHRRRDVVVRAAQLSGVHVKDKEETVTNH